MMMIGMRQATSIDLYLHLLQNNSLNNNNSIMFEKQRDWVRRVNRLVEYMNYDWDKDEKWLEYYTA